MSQKNVVNTNSEDKEVNSNQNHHYSDRIKIYKINEVKKGEKMLNDISINKKLIIKKIIGK